MVESFIRGYIFFAGEEGREGPEPLFNDLLYKFNKLQFSKGGGCLDPKTSFPLDLRKKIIILYFK